jgi:Zn finger protein HypA/HybF involved in hydrogenase expression
MKERTTDPGNFSQLRRGVDLSAAQAATDSGIEVHEEELGTVTVQQLYKVRCECGRSWFELKLPKFVECPACHKLSVVSG